MENIIVISIIILIFYSQIKKNIQDIILDILVTVTFPLKLIIYQWKKQKKNKQKNS